MKKASFFLLSSSSSSQYCAGRRLTLHIRTLLYANSRLVSSSHFAFASCCAKLTSLFASCLLTMSPQHRVPSSRAPTQPVLQLQHPQSAAHCTSKIQGRHHPVSATTNVFSRWAAASWAVQPSGNTGMVSGSVSAKANVCRISTESSGGIATSSDAEGWSVSIVGASFARCSCQLQYNG